MREQRDEAQQLLRDAPTSIVMTYNDPKLAIVARDGRIRTLYTDKRKVKTANGNADTQARWDGYALGENGGQLRRAYDRVSEDRPGPERGLP